MAIAKIDISNYTSGSLNLYKLLKHNSNVSCMGALYCSPSYIDNINRRTKFQLDISTSSETKYD